MAIGDIVPCPIFNHAETCGDPRCQDERGRSHADCTWCLGAKRMRIVTEREGGYEVAPL